MSPFDFEKEDSFMQIDLQKSQHSNEETKRKLDLFRQKRHQAEQSGIHFAAKIKERHQHMKEQEFLQNIVKFNPEYVEADRTVAGRDPI